MLALLLACAEPPLEATATPSAAGVRVEASRPVDRVEVVDGAAVVVTRRRLEVPSAVVEVPGELAPGAYVVRAQAGEARVEVPLAVVAPPPWRLEVQVAPGQPWAAPEAEVRVPVVGDGPATVRLAVVGGPGHPAAVPWSGGDPIGLTAPGRREVRTLPLAEAATVTVGDRAVRFVPDRVDPAALGALLAPGEPSFPTDALGVPEVGRPAFRVPLPDPAWVEAGRALGLAPRAEDPAAPWAWAALPLRSAADRPLDLVVTLEVRDDAGAASAFRPRLRAGDGDTGVVSGLVRVAPGAEVAAVLPVFVDRRAVADGAYRLRWVVTPLGADTPVATAERPLYVQRGDRRVAVGFVGTLALAVGGLGWTGLRVRRWLEGAPTSELMTIALFGAALFVVSSATDLVAMAVGAVLGPFAPLVTGLVADVGRAVLLATLLTLLPRPGVLALCLLTAWIGRNLVLGGFSPVDLLHVGTSVALGEGFAWLAGLTRGGGWREGGRVARWLRLTVALGGASLVGTVAGLLLHVVLYRLFFADWYVWLTALGPGFLYVAVANAVAVPFADSLRRVDG